jgi:hypothetical protein
MKKKPPGSRLAAFLQALMPSGSGVIWRHGQAVFPLFDNERGQKHAAAASVL